MIHSMTKIFFFICLAALTFVGCSRNDYYDASNFGTSGMGGSVSELSGSASAKQLSVLEQTKDCLSGCHGEATGDYNSLAEVRLPKIKEKHAALGDGKNFEDYWTNPHRSVHGSGAACTTCHEIDKSVNSRCSNSVKPDCDACNTCHRSNFFIHTEQGIMSPFAEPVGTPHPHENRYAGFYDPENIEK